MTEHPRDLACPKCQARLTPGQVHSYSDVLWAERPAGFFGTYPGRTNRVITYRCESCGFLESYTLPAGQTLKSVLAKN